MKISLSADWTVKYLASSLTEGVPEAVRLRCYYLKRQGFATKRVGVGGPAAEQGASNHEADVGCRSKTSPTMHDIIVDERCLWLSLETIGYA